MCWCLLTNLLILDKNTSKERKKERKHLRDFLPKDTISPLVFLTSLDLTLTIIEERQFVALLKPLIKESFIVADTRDDGLFKQDLNKFL